jgi:hypothetical protein
VHSKSMLIVLALLMLTACTIAPTPVAQPTSENVTPAASVNAATDTTTPTSITESTAPPQSDLLVYQAWDGGPQPELIVRQPDGTEVHRIALPESVNYVENIFAMRGSHTALAVTDGGRWFIVRAALGEVQELDFPAELRGKMTLGWSTDNVGRRWALMEDQQRQHFYLVDLQTGQLTDLAAINKEFRFIDQIQLSQRDDYLAIFTKNDGLWLVPAAEPSKARRIKTTLRLPSGYLADDGQFAVFRDRRSNNKPLLVSENVDTGDRQEIEFREDLFGVRPIASSHQAVLAQLDGRVWFDLDAEKAIAQISIAKQEHVGESFVSPDHEKYFYNWYDDAKSKGEWIVIESSTGVTRTIPDLTGYFPIQKTMSVSAAPWAVMLKTLSESSPQKYQLAVFDIRSEKVLPLMTFESSNPLGQLRFTSDSPFGVVLHEAPDGKQQLWLVNADKGEVNKIAEADVVDGAVSLSDQWAAVNTANRQTKEVKVSVINTATGQALSMGEGVTPAWVVP